MNLATIDENSKVIVERDAQLQEVREQLAQLKQTADQQISELQATVQERTQEAEETRT